MAGGRHRNPGSDVTFKGGDTPFALPFSTSTGRSSPPAASAFNGEGPRARRPVAMNDSSELDIRYDMHDISPTTQQPDFSFPTVSSAAYSPPPSPPPKEAPPVLAKKGAGGFYSKSSSIAQAREHKSARQGPLHHQHQQAPQWRDKGQELARLRKKAASDKGLSMQQIVAGAGTLAVLVLVVVLWGSSRGKSPLVKHMQRREQILAASLMPSPPGIVRSIPSVFGPGRDSDVSSACRPSRRRFASTTRSETSSVPTRATSLARHMATSVRHAPAHKADFCTEHLTVAAEQTMNLYHLTHLSTILSRIPIAHPFLLPDDSGQIAQHPVPTIFDLSRFSAGTSVAVLDWNDLRPHEGAETGKTEPLGCWVGQIGETERDDRAKRMRLTGLSPSFVPVRLAPSKSAAGQGDDLKGTLHRSP